MRVSKSTILNINHIYSITRNLTSSSIVEFQNTHKQVYVSRHYYKPLKFKLLEKRGDKMKKERIFWGILLVLGSIALIVNKLGYFAHVNVFSILLTVFLIGIMIKSILNRSFAGIEIIYI